ncbi:hypothetical protein KRP22_012395 [Phytophthora ramorum]|nr:Sugar transporter SWEET1 [Phytophthora ramorum]
MLGYFAHVMAVIMFGAPLMLLRDVVKTNNSEVIAAHLAISGFVNGISWSVYGIVQTNLLPNAIDSILCLVHILSEGN